tara:strand:- start:292 stop:393 length:102 start_codon:yes stop_codon:yes gene_type:complete
MAEPVQKKKTPEFSCHAAATRFLLRHSTSGSLT